MLLKLDGFQYAISLVKKRCYYHDKNASNFCTLILYMGEDNNKIFPMGVSRVSRSPGNYQLGKKMKTTKHIPGLAISCLFDRNSDVKRYFAFFLFGFKLR